MTSTAQTRRSLPAQLAEIQAQFDAASQKARALVEGLSSEQLTQRPQPSQWSVAECLAHLNITSAEYRPILNAAFEDARKQQAFGSGPFKMDLMGKLLKWALEPPARFKTKTADKFKPVKVESVGEVLPTFLNQQEQLKALVEKADGLALNKVKVISPFSSRVRYNLLSCFNVILAHERRHLWQAEQVRSSVTGMRA